MRRIGSATTVTSLLLLAVILFLAGCASTPLAFDKPGVMKAEREQDENVCLRSAIGVDSTGRLGAAYCVDRDAYIRCMQGRGYAVRPE